MPEVKLDLSVIEPFFLKGADPRGEPEWRAPSVRGHLRYWLRAIEGGRLGGNLPDVWAVESAMFGSTGCGSLVTVRCRDLQPAPAKCPSAFLLPHRAQNRAPDRTLPDGVRVALTLTTRMGVPLPVQVLQALTTWLLLGGAGKRSRRMFGALDVIGHSPEGTGYFWDATGDWTTFVRAVQSHFAWLYPARPAPMPVPTFPTLHPDHAWVVVGEATYDSAEDANVALFGLLRSAKFLDQPVFGYVEGGHRRSSPLIAQVVRVGGELRPVLTALRSTHNEWRPLPKAQWDLMNDFMNSAIGMFGGVSVHGGPLT